MQDHAHCPCSQTRPPETHLAVNVEQESMRMSRQPAAYKERANSKGKLTGRTAAVGEEGEKGTCCDRYTQEGCSHHVGSGEHEVGMHLHVLSRQKPKFGINSSLTPIELGRLGAHSTEGSGQGERHWESIPCSFLLFDYLCTVHLAWIARKKETPVGRFFFLQIFYIFF